MRKILFAVALLLVLAAAVALAALYLVFPAVGPPEDLRVAIEPARVERGRYLATSVTVCIDCHSRRDWSRFSGPIVPGTVGMGGESFDASMGFPGTIHAPNITPAGVGDWTDGELLRAFTTGVARDGRALFPLMPCASYGRLTRDDAEAIVAYLRTLEPIENDVPPTELDFPMNLVVRTIPRPARPTPAFDRTDTIAHGRYLATVGGCSDCHTPKERGANLPDMAYAGGMSFEGPWGSLRSTNITPHPESGIGEWNREFFIRRFKLYDSEDGAASPVGPGDFNTVMPWVMYSRMTVEDLGAIYDYLRTIAPVDHRVDPERPTGARAGPSTGKARPVSKSR